MSSPRFILSFKRNKIQKSLTRLFLDKPMEFTGLYGSIDRINRGLNKQNYKALDEFYQRISYMPEYADLTGVIQPLFPTQNQTEKTLKDFTSVVIDAMICADIRREKINRVIILTEKNVLNYREMNGQDIYVDDKVKIVAPGYYQNGKAIEKGACVLVD